MENQEPNPRPDQAPAWRRRSIYIIDREFQFRFMTTWLVMTLGFVLIVLAVLWAGLTSIKSMAATTGKEFIWSDLAFMMKANAIFIILLTVYMALHTIMLSHRIAGPAYRLCQSIKRLRTGDYDFAVVLRKKDHLKNVADNLNELIVSLKRRNENAKAALEQVVKAQTSLASAGSVPTEVSAALAAAQARLAEATRIEAETKAEQSSEEPKRG
jgi:methyl-accepting chemotaxis protein